MSLEKLETQITNYFAEEKYRELIVFLEENIENCPQHNYLYWYLGLAWFLLEAEAKATDIWLTVILEQSEEETSQFLQLLITTANQHLQQRKFKQAEKLYEQILELDDTQAEIYFNYGNAIAQGGDIDRAIELWQNAIILQDNYQPALHNLASAWQKLGDYNLAINSYENLLQIEPNDYNILYNLGLCYAQNNQLDNALKCFQQCIDINPNFSPAYGDIGYLLASKSLINQALNFWKKWGEKASNFIKDYLAWLEQIKTENLPINNSINACYNFLKFLQNPREELFFFKNLQPLTREEKSKVNLSSDYVPQGYYHTTKEWANSFSEKTINYFPIYPENYLNLKPPHTNDKYIHYSYRFGDKVTLPESFVTIIPEGRFWLSEDEASSAVITPDGKILGDLSPETPFLSPGHPDNHPSRHSLLQIPTLSPPEYIDAKVAVLAGVLNDIYFHWMFDILPRFNLLNSANLDLTSIDYFLVSNNQHFQQESLEKLGIESRKIIQVEQHKHLCAKDLIVPSFPGTVAWMPPWSCDFLKQLFLPKNTSDTKPNKLIYISRKKSGVRRLINENEIINLLEKEGFMVVNLESMSVEEQALLLSQAKVVISPHGSGLTNLVFCREDTKVIEIFSPYYVYPCYWLVSNLVGLEYHYLLGENPEGLFLHQLFFPSAREDDIWLNPKKLLELL